MDPLRRTTKSRVLEVIAVLGLIAVLLLGAWGIVQLAFSLGDLLSGESKEPQQYQVCQNDKCEIVESYSMYTENCIKVRDPQKLICGTYTVEKI